MYNCRSFAAVNGLSAPQAWRLHYSPLKAADEKIPLSMGHVNPKPQYLVFCCHFPHLAFKHRPFACGKRRNAPSATGFSLRSDASPRMTGLETASSTSVAPDGIRFKAHK
jgi:hypothetical protein